MLARLMLKPPPALAPHLQYPCLISCSPWRSQLQRMPHRQFAGTSVRGRTGVTGQNGRSRGQVLPEVGQPESVKLETVQPAAPLESNGVPKTDALLTEQTVSNKEQRKADWAIMKEMSRYLWPKVPHVHHDLRLVALTLGLG